MSKQAAIDFFQRVAAMRAAQIRYYNDRTYQSLSKARKLEKEVDGYIEKGMNYLDKLHEQQNQQQTIKFPQ